MARAGLTRVSLSRPGGRLGCTRMTLPPIPARRQASHAPSCLHRRKARAPLSTESIDAAKAQCGALSRWPQILEITNESCSGVERPPPAVLARRRLAAGFGGLRRLRRRRNAQQRLRRRQRGAVLASLGGNREKLVPELFGRLRTSSGVLFQRAKDEPFHRLADRSIRRP